MRILQLIYSLQAGGAERFVVTLANELAERGHEVVLLQLLDDKDSKLTFNRQFLSDKVVYKNAGLAPGFSISKLRKISETIRRLSPDVVHGHLNVMPYALPLFLRKSGMRFVHTLHNVAEYASGARYQKPLNRWLYRTERVVPVTISGFCDKSYKEYYNLADSRLIDNGTPVTQSTPEFEKARTEIQNIKRTPSTKVLLHLGRFNPQKNQRLLVEAFTELKREGEDVILVVLGGGFDSPEGEELKKLAGEGAHFLGVKGNVGDYLLNSDLFCMSSNYEGLPISLLEALSAGVTPVCTAVGGIPDVIREGENGYLAQKVELEDYVAALKRGLRNPINPEKLRACFEENYSIQKCADRYLEIYTGK